MISSAERTAMLRVVSYLKGRAERLYSAAERCEPGGEAGETAKIKALGLVEAAAAVEKGIAAEEVA